jgi:C-terminal processing protease CtpA/Prc
LVTGVAADRPGAEAGMKVGDTIQAIDERIIKDKNFEDAVRLQRRETSAGTQSVTLPQHEEY